MHMPPGAFFTSPGPHRPACLFGGPGPCRKSRLSPSASAEALPGSEILSAEMMLRHMGWHPAADLIISSMEKSILAKKVTYDFARLLDGATQVSCSGFGQVMIDNM